jgi:hypothetical protein
MHPFLLSAMISITGDYTSFTVTQKLISYFLVVITGSSVLCIGYTMIKNKIKETKKDTVTVSNQ